MWIVELERKRKLIISHIVVDKSRVKNVGLFYVCAIYYFLMILETDEAFFHKRRTYFYCRTRLKMQKSMFTMKINVDAYEYRGSSKNFSLSSFCFTYHEIYKIC